MNVFGNLIWPVFILYACGFASFLYFLYWIIPIVLRWVLWEWFPPVNRKVPYVEPETPKHSLYIPPEIAIQMQQASPEQLAQVNAGLQNCTPTYRMGDLQNIASAAAYVAAAAGFSL
jgi:hypothetical protein